MRGAIELRNLGKAYGSTLALKNVSHAFEPGRVHALMGKNGSGKSTLIEILAGSVRPTVGELWVNGERVSFDSPADALAAGIVTVHQELSLVPSLSIAENIFLGRPLKKRRFGIEVVNWKAMVAEADALLADMGVAIDSRRLVGQLTVGQQQTIEIIKAASSDPAILLLDEPTSALAAQEVDQLFQLIRRLKQRGVTMVYISHRMNELFEICDTCTVLRDGSYVGSVELAASSPEEIVGMMFGDINPRKAGRRHYAGGERILEVRDLGRSGAFSGISFDLHRGEVLGIAGLLGSGRTELLRAIFGAEPFDSGTVTLNGTKVDRPTPRRMRRMGLAYTPEDRKHSALVQILSVKDNLVLANLSRISTLGVVSAPAFRKMVSEQIDTLAIKVADPALPVSKLSGGNQQKVVVGNWLNTQPRVIFFDEPTRGIDLRAKEQIFDIVAAQAARGVSCVFVSSELEEVHAIADRILVLRQGRLVADVDPGSHTLSDIYKLCMKGSLDD